MEVKDWPLSARTINALINYGIYNIDDLKGRFIEELQEIPGIGAGSIREIREWCKTKYKVTFKKRPKEKVIKDYKGAKSVVQHLLAKPKDWPKQLKVADQLILKYGLELLLRVKPQEKIWSLVWYNTDYGDKYIRQFMKGTVSVEETPKEEIRFEDDEDFTVVNKPKSLKDFLKL